MNTTQTGSHEFGEVVSKHAIVNGLVALAGIVNVVLGSLFLVPVFNPPKTSAWYTSPVLWIGCAVAWSIGLGVMLILRSRTPLELRERGAVVRRRKGDQLIPYSSLEGFTFRTVRQYLNGIYFGTSLTMSLTGTDRKTIKFSGRYKEKPIGLSFSMLSSKFTPDEKMDRLRSTIAGHIAERWHSHIEQHGAVDWAKFCAISSDGVTARSGTYRGMLIRFEEIGGVGIDQGLFFMQKVGDKKPFLTVETGAENFWAALAVLEDFATVSEGEAPAELAAAA
ncbi:MAG: hypothetical protein IPK69_00420 [Phycisphaerales bacterium]|nr:MAG: hypothetical protein IPK69_00420 [Phycisphaerales bacterium]